MNERDPGERPGEQFTEFDEMVLLGDLRDVELDDQIRVQRIRLKGCFALVVDEGLEELEEPEEY